MKDTLVGALDVVQIMSAILVLILGIGLLAVIVMYAYRARLRSTMRALFMCFSSAVL